MFNVIWWDRSWRVWLALCSALWLILRVTSLFSVSGIGSISACILVVGCVWTIVMFANRVAFCAIGFVIGSVGVCVRLTCAVTPTTAFACLSYPSTPATYTKSPSAAFALVQSVASNSTFVSMSIHVASTGFIVFWSHVLVYSLHVTASCGGLSRALLILVSIRFTLFSCLFHRYCWYCCRRSCSSVGESSIKWNQEWLLLKIVHTWSADMLTRRCSVPGTKVVTNVRIVNVIRFIVVVYCPIITVWSIPLWSLADC